MMELPFTITGTVIHGRALGNTYDSPTANISPAENISSLSYGVYFSTVSVDGRKFYAITNLGVRPTVSSTDEVCAETYIYDFDGDLYGRSISVTLLKFHRDERKFDSVDELFATVSGDLRAGADYFNISTLPSSIFTSEKLS